jgi:hypothetical protein
MLEFVIFIISFSIFSIVVADEIRLRYKIANLRNKWLSLNIENAILKENILMSVQAQEADSTKEGFLKFISQSRDWAFEYIETAQSGIKEFVDVAGPDIEYMEKFRPPIILEETQDRLINSYNKLKLLLPEDEK